MERTGSHDIYFGKHISMIQSKCSKIDKRPIGTTISGTFLHADPEYVLLKNIAPYYHKMEYFLNNTIQEKNNFLFF